MSNIIITHNAIIPNALAYNPLAYNTITSNASVSNKLSKQRLSKQPHIIEYRARFKHHLTTTRFNNLTWSENEAYRQQNQKIGCIYPTTEPNGQTMPEEANLFVLEMNNEQNRIMGIGLVKNKPIYNKYHVYSDPKYNCYAYLGKNRIDRLQMTNDEERIMKVFDILCFKGSRHMKRLVGLKAFPIDMLYNCSTVFDLVEFITNMFRERIKTQTNKTQPDKDPNE
jgi:hypothetical protein